MIFKPMLMAAAFGALGLGLQAASQPAAMADPCPGKIVCPVTGELVCRDKCPRLDANRPNCPGLIECPRTGELVCADRCPLEADTSAAAPACCAAKGAL